MLHDTKPPVETRDDEEDAFLIPPGQPGAMVDRLAAEQGWLPGFEPADAEYQLELAIRVVLRGGRM